ncbi:hypothetical protein RRG08_017062 [Elysia crispata]|uniref:Uncharacterized protein n=1 Tax=Elysia crispata TaxID=231223 RepID=A0AAE1DC20_9GAST|nr:hypothetical protein RRG08_017062 [Elysia crispata]
MRFYCITLRRVSILWYAGVVTHYKNLVNSSRSDCEAKSCTLPAKQLASTVVDFTKVGPSSRDFKMLNRLVSGGKHYRKSALGEVFGMGAAGRFGHKAGHIQIFVRCLA